MSWPDIIAPRPLEPCGQTLHRVRWPEGEEPSGPIDPSDAREYARITDVAREYQTVEDMLAAAVEYAETATRRTIALTLWDLVLDTFPSGVIELRRPPVLEVVQVQYRNSADVWTVIDPADYDVQIDGDRATVGPLAGESWPGVGSQPRSVRLRYRAGCRPWDYVADPDEVTPPWITPHLRSAICELFTFRFDTRGIGSSNRLIEVAVPSSIDAAFWSERVDL